MINEESIIRKSFTLNIIFNRAHYATIASIALSTFYLALIMWNAFIFIGYEGQWQIYSQKLESGSNIHADLHYLLPSLYPKIFSFLYSMSHGWVIVDALHIFLFICAPVIIFLTIRKLTYDIPRDEAFLYSIISSLYFFLFPPLRVVDYHVVSILSVLLVSYFFSFRSLPLSFLCIPIICVDSSVRITDGAALGLASIAASFILFRYSFLKYAFALSIALFFWFILVDADYIIGDTLNSAAKTKGITFFEIFKIAIKSILAVPWYWVKNGDISLKVLSGFALLIIGINLINSKITRGIAMQAKTYEKLFYCFLFLLPAYITSNDLTWLVMLGFTCGYYLIWRCIDQSDDVLLSNTLIIFSYFFSSALSSRGAVAEHGPQAAGFIMLFFAKTRPLYKFKGNVGYYYLLSGILFATVVTLAKSPISWHHNKSPSLFSSTIPFSEGFITKPVKRTMDIICPLIIGEETLAMPFPFYAFACKAKVWGNGAVLFYDTSDKSSIQSVIDALHNKMPRYIVYTRQLGNLEAHENIFSSGDRIPHRDLDDYIFSLIDSGVIDMIEVIDINGKEVPVNNKLINIDGLWKEIRFYTFPVLILLKTRNY